MRFRNGGLTLLVVFWELRQEGVTGWAGRGETLTDLLEELLHIDRVPGAGLDEDGRNGLRKVLGLLHGNFPVSGTTGQELTQTKHTHTHTHTHTVSCKQSQTGMRSDWENQTQELTMELTHQELRYMDNCVCLFPFCLGSVKVLLSP